MIGRRSAKSGALTLCAVACLSLTCTRRRDSGDGDPLSGTDNPFEAHAQLMGVHLTDVRAALQSDERLAGPLRAAHERIMVLAAQFNQGEPYGMMAGLFEQPSGPQAERELREFLAGAYSAGTAEWNDVFAAYRTLSPEDRSTREAEHLRRLSTPGEPNDKVSRQGWLVMRWHLRTAAAWSFVCQDGIVPTY